MDFDTSEKPQHRFRLVERASVTDAKDVTAPAASVVQGTLLLHSAGPLGAGDAAHKAVGSMGMGELLPPGTESVAQSPAAAVTADEDLQK